MKDCVCFICVVFLQEYPGAGVVFYSGVVLYFTFCCNGIGWYSIGGGGLPERYVNGN